MFLYTLPTKNKISHIAKKGKTLHVNESRFLATRLESKQVTDSTGVTVSKISKWLDLTQVPHEKTYVSTRIKLKANNTWVPKLWKNITEVNYGTKLMFAQFALQSSNAESQPSLSLLYSFITWCTKISDSNWLDHKIDSTQFSVATKSVCQDFLKKVQGIDSKLDRNLDHDPELYLKQWRNDDVIGYQITLNQRLIFKKKSSRTINGDFTIIKTSERTWVTVSYKSDIECDPIWPWLPLEPGRWSNKIFKITTLGMWSQSVAEMCTKCTKFSLTSVLSKKSFDEDIMTSKRKIYTGWKNPLFSYF